MRKLLLAAFAATWLLLLGLCVYVATQLGYINLPFIPGGRSPTPVATGIVPNLLGKEYVTSQEVAQEAGFTIRLVGGSTPAATSIVIGQNPSAGTVLLKGSAIAIQMGPKSTRVPNSLVNTTLASLPHAFPSSLPLFRTHSLQASSLSDACFFGGWSSLGSGIG